MTAARAARASALTYRSCWTSPNPGNRRLKESQTRNASKASAPCPAVCSACRKTRGTPRRGDGAGRLRVGKGPALRYLPQDRQDH